MLPQASEPFETLAMRLGYFFLLVFSAKMIDLEAGLYLSTAQCSCSISVKETPQSDHSQDSHSGIPKVRDFLGLRALPQLQ